MSDHSRTMRMYTRTRRRYIKETCTTYSTAVGKTRPTARVVLEDAVRVGKSEDLEKTVNVELCKRRRENTSVCPGTRCLSGSRRKERGSTPYNARRNPQPRTGKHIRPPQKTNRRASESAHKRPDEVPRAVPLGLRRDLVHERQ